MIPDGALTYAVMELVVYIAGIVVVFGSVLVFIGWVIYKIYRLIRWIILAVWRWLKKHLTNGRGFYKVDSNNEMEG